MGNKYIAGINPFQDLLFTSIMYDVDLLNNEVKDDIYDSLVFILENVLDDLDELEYLDYDIIKRNNVVKIIGNNIISALWLSGIIPYDTEKVLNENRFEFNNRIYYYNKTKKKLTWKEKR